MSSSRSKSDRWANWTTVILGILILIPSMYGFIGKFIEFVHIYRGTPGGEFAVAPIVNYLLATLGFFCLLLWATAHGMFRDMERPKYEMLKNETLLDRSAPSIKGNRHDRA